MQNIPKVSEQLEYSFTFSFVGLKDCLTFEHGFSQQSFRSVILAQRFSFFFLLHGIPQELCMISIKVLEGFSETLIFSWAKYYLNTQLVWFRSEGSISVTGVIFFSFIFLSVCNQKHFCRLQSSYFHQYIHTHVHD